MSQCPWEEYAERVERMAGIVIDTTDTTDRQPTLGDGDGDGDGDGGGDPA